jgi:hypothetical protein
LGVQVNEGDFHDGGRRTDGRGRGQRSDVGGRRTEDRGRRTEDGRAMRDQ